MRNFLWNFYLAIASAVGFCSSRCLLLCVLMCTLHFSILLWICCTASVQQNHNKSLKSRTNPQQWERPPVNPQQIEMCTTNPQHLGVSRCCGDLQQIKGIEFGFQLAMDKSTTVCNKAATYNKFDNKLYNSPHNIK